jgi:hypothetical protein
MKMMFGLLAPTALGAAVSSAHARHPKTKTNRKDK